LDLGPLGTPAHCRLAGGGILSQGGGCWRSVSPAWDTGYRGRGGMGALTTQRGELEQTCFFAADNVQGDSWAGCHLPQPKVQISGTGRARAPACRLVGVQGGWHSHGWHSCSWSNSAPPARPHPHHPVSCPRADLQGQTATQSATAAHGRSAKATATCRRQGCRPTATIK
jgi:hypothetical protein